MNEPPLQNIPIESDLSKRIKEVLREDRTVLLPTLDYSAIELRVLANMSEEEVKEFLKGPP